MVKKDPKHAINFWETEIVYVHFEHLLGLCNSSEPSSKGLQLIKK